MNRYLTTLAAAGVAAGVAFGGPAQATDAPLWANVGVWKVAVDDSLGHGCFMMSNYGGQNVVLRIGFDNRDNSLYFVIGSSAWQSLEPGKVYTINGQFDNGTMETWQATAFQFGGTGPAYLKTSFRNPYGSMNVFGQRLNFKLYYRGSLLANMNLNGTAAAAAETANCNRQFAGGHGGDPFNAPAPAPVKADPFNQS